MAKTQWGVIYLRNVHAWSLQLCPTYCDPMDCSPQGSSVHGISQARILEWVAISFSNLRSGSCDKPKGFQSPLWMPTRNSVLSSIYAAAAAAKSLQSCPTLCNPRDGSPPGSSVHRILQERILEWVAISFSNACMHAKSLQSCLTLCDPMDSSPPGSSVHRILQARVLEWSSIYGHVEFWMKRMASSFLPWSQHTQRATYGSLLCHLSRGRRLRGLGSETMREGWGEGVLRLSRGEQRCDA